MGYGEGEAFTFYYKRIETLREKTTQHHADMSPFLPKARGLPSSLCLHSHRSHRHYPSAPEDQSAARTQHMLIFTVALGCPAEFKASAPALHTSLLKEQAKSLISQQSETVGNHCP